MNPGLLIRFVPLDDVGWLGETQGFILETRDLDSYFFGT